MDGPCGLIAINGARGFIATNGAYERIAILAHVAHTTGGEMKTLMQMDIDTFRDIEVM